MRRAHLPHTAPLLLAVACASTPSPPPASPAGHTVPEASLKAPPPPEVPMRPLPGGGATPAADAQGLVEALVSKHGEAVRPRTEKGVAQVVAFWRNEDGDAA